MDKIVDVFKIVRETEHPGVYGSAIVGDYGTNPFYIIYKMGLISYPPSEYPLAYLYAFKDKHTAKMWAGRWGNKVFRAEAVTVDEIPYAVDRVISFEMDMFWKDDTDLVSLDYAPKGTVWCKQIELIEEV